MTCQTLSDRMPAVAAGHGAWSEAERRHLDTCAGCAAEWRVVSAAARLGRRVEQSLDPAAMADRVVARLRTEGPGRRVPRLLWWGGGVAAAAAAMVLLLVRGDAPAPGPAGPVPPFAIELTELDGLTEDQLQAVLDGMDIPLTEGTVVVPPSLESLDDQQLERILRAMEG